MNRPLLSRRAVAFLARAGAAGSAVMLALTIFTLSPGEADPGRRGRDPGRAGHRDQPRRARRAGRRPAR